MHRGDIMPGFECNKLLFSCVKSMKTLLWILS